MEIVLGTARDSQIHGKKCGDCNHAISKHRIAVETESDDVNAKCTICDCDGVLFTE